ncbi:hypothetical protein CDAR_425551 [Caerostris darwini]|uniref:Uncharacterized protein n=1 Tax=Caerostris darwini TaxID=1538125 RepID=A0AAV4VLH8_9ARAC|nr:hypothetical protein CDAR_425551 [Caerostris darwini]
MTLIHIHCHTKYQSAVIIDTIHSPSELILFILLFPIRIVQSARSAGKSRGGCESVVRGHVHIFKYVGKLKSRELWIHVHERLTYNIPWICQQDEQTAQLLSECFTPGE